MLTVVCTGGDAPPASLCRAWLGAATSIIAADSGLEHVKAAGHRADVWVGDGDSLSPSLDLWKPWFSESQPLRRDKDDTDTEAAVKLAVASGADEVWLVGGGGGRMDHWWANLRMVAVQPAVTRWLTAYEEIWSLGPGASLGIDTGTISVFPLGDGPWKVESEGLKWPLATVDFARWHSLSNEAALGARVLVRTGRVLVIRPLRDTA